MTPAPRHGGRPLAAIALVAALGAFRPAQAYAQDTGWTIPSFQAEYIVNIDRSIDVTERIMADFGTLQRHGIYRDIPVRYARVIRAGVPIDAGTVSVGLGRVRVTNGQGQPLTTHIERGSRVRIRIGDADRMVSGVQTYVIRYHLTRGLGFFPDHDELYWQVTGTEWPVPILRAAATVTVAPAMGMADADTTHWSAWCYAGVPRSSSSDGCEARFLGTGRYGYASGRLAPGEGLTLVAVFPKGVIPQPTPADRLAERVAIWWPAAIPVLGFVALLAMWWRHGREPDAGSIVPEWHPPQGIPAGAAGTLVRQSADMNDVVATLIDLAVRGYLRITEVPPTGIGSSLEQDSIAARALHAIGLAKVDWEFTRAAKPLPGDLVPYEQSTLDGVFEGQSVRRMSELHNQFYKHISGIKSGMMALLMQQQLFRGNPNTVRGLYFAGGVAVLIAGVLAGGATHNLILGAGVALLGVLLLGFAPAMPARTPLGARRMREVKGLEEYIRRAEKHDLELSQAPRKTTELFSTLLPYALALGVSDIWVRQFADVLAAAPPSWYVGSSPTFHGANFAGGFSDFRSAASTIMASAPGSSSGAGGGGSVGGGGGGGGGGSW